MFLSNTFVSILQLGMLLQGREKEADQRRRILAEGSQSDHIMLAKAFQVFALYMITMTDSYLFVNVTHYCDICIN